uniref:Uncharacterized protein n=1 Tax=Acrobeloides nanus TaxID=290746 RepID=A0A914EA90_9BILA
MDSVVRSFSPIRADFIRKYELVVNQLDSTQIGYDRSLICHNGICFTPGDRRKTHKRSLNQGWIPNDESGIDNLSSENELKGFCDWAMCVKPNEP